MEQKWPVRLQKQRESLKCRFRSECSQVPTSLKLWKEVEMKRHFVSSCFQCKVQTDMLSKFCVSSLVKNSYHHHLLIYLKWILLECRAQLTYCLFPYLAREENLCGFQSKKWKYPPEQPTHQRCCWSLYWSKNGTFAFYYSRPPTLLKYYISIDFHMQ